MAEHTNIYWAFPESSSAQVKGTYVHVVDKVTKEEVKKVVERIFMFYEDFIHETPCSYYDSDNVENFLHDVTTPKRIYPSRQMMDSALKIHHVKNCRKMKGRSQTRMIYPFLLGVRNTLLEALANNMSSLDEARSAFLILNVEGIDTQADMVKLNNGNGELAVDVRQIDKDSLYQWFADNRKPARVWLWNPKHGDKFIPQQNIPGEKVSRLWSTQDEAKENLPKAISVAVVDSKNGDMYMFDAQYDAYIDFKASSGTWHAFHLDEEDEKQKITPELLERLKLFGLDRK